MSRLLRGATPVKNPTQGVFCVDFGDLNFYADCSVLLVYCVGKPCSPALARRLPVLSLPATRGPLLLSVG